MRYGTICGEFKTKNQAAKHEHRLSVLGYAGLWLKPPFAVGFGWADPINNWTQR